MEIKNKDGLLKHKGISEDSRIFCDKIEYIYNKEEFQGKDVLDHHLMFYLKGQLVFKVWLKNKKYKEINEALKDVGISVENGNV